MNNINFKTKKNLLQKRQYAREHYYKNKQKKLLYLKHYYEENKQHIKLYNQDKKAKLPRTFNRKNVNVEINFN